MKKLKFLIIITILVFMCIPINVSAKSFVDISTQQNEIYSLNQNIDALINKLIYFDGATSNLTQTQLKDIENTKKLITFYESSVSQIYAQINNLYDVEKNQNQKLKEALLMAILTDFSSSLLSLREYTNNLDKNIYLKDAINYKGSANEILNNYNNLF